MLTVVPIGHVVGGRSAPVDDDWDAVTATIRLDATRFTPDALRGLDAFSHLEVLYPGARRLRGNPAWPAVGIFAQRGKDRPNRLGVSICRIEAVAGTDVHVRGLDAIDGTPVLSEFLPRGELRQSTWATELMTGHW